MIQGNKILFCDNTLWGLINFRKDVIQHFVDAGKDVVLVAPQDESSFLTIDVPTGVKYIPVKLDRCSRNPFSDFLYCIRLYKIYKKERPDYIFHYTIKPNIYGGFAARLLKIPFFDVMSGLGYGLIGNNLSTKIAAKLYKWAFHFAERVFSLNQNNYNFLIDNGFMKKSKLNLLNGGEGINLKEFSYIKEEADSPNLFIMVARVLIDKGYREFVQAAKLVKKQDKTARFLVLGPLDYSYPTHILREEVEADAASGAIEYLGSTNNVSQYIAHPGTVVVLPSYHEGLNRSLMEACAMGRPIITTDIPGCRETVDEGKNGFLVKVKDAPSLAEAILKYIQLPSEQKIKMSEYSRRKAEESFDVKHVIEEYERVITDSNK